MSFASKAIYWYKKGKNIKIKIAKNKKEINEIKQEIEHLNSLVKRNELFEEQQIENLKSKLKEKYSIIADLDKQLNEAIFNLEHIIFNANKDEKKFLNAFRHTAGINISSSDNNAAKGYIIEAKNNSLKHVNELKNLQKTIRGFIYTLKAENDKFLYALEESLNSTEFEIGLRFNNTNNLKNDVISNPLNYYHSRYNNTYYSYNKPKNYYKSNYNYNSIPSYYNKLSNYLPITQKIKPTKSYKDIGNIKISNNYSMSPLEKIVSDTTKKSNPFMNIYDRIKKMSEKFYSLPEKTNNYIKNLYIAPLFKPTKPILTRYINPVSVITRYNPLKNIEYNRITDNLSKLQTFNPLKYTSKIGKYIGKGIYNVGNSVYKITKSAVNGFFSKFLKK